MYRDGGGTVEIKASFLLMVLGAALVTWLSRVLPLIVLNRLKLPPWALRFLSHVPVAVFAALLAQDIMTSEGNIVPLTNNVKIVALIPTFAAALLTRSLLGTVIVGIVSMIAIKAFF